MKIILMNGGEVEKVFQTEGIAREKAWRQAGRTHALGTERSYVWFMLRRVVEKQM